MFPQPKPNDDADIMTVILYFYGGPRDGGYKRVSSNQLIPGGILLVIKKSHLYSANQPYQVEDTRVDLHHRGPATVRDYENSAILQLD